MRRLHKRYKLNFKQKSDKKDLFLLCFCLRFDIFFMYFVCMENENHGVARKRRAWIETWMKKRQQKQK